MFQRIVLVTALVIFSSAAFAQKTYKIMGDPDVGSKFRPVEAESLIPFDKTYSELSDDHKNIFRANYGVLKDSEHPPFPKDGLESIYNPLIKGHAKIARGGTLFLVAMVDEKGKVENVAVYESPADSVTELANTVLFNTEFEPASCDGNPCKMEFPFEFKMRQKAKIVNK